MATGQANTTRWFQRDDQKPDAAAVKFVTDQLAVIESGLDVAGKNPDRRLKAQAIAKRKLLKTALDYYRGKRAYFQLGRDYTAKTAPKDEARFEALVMSEINDIPLMFERGGVKI